MLYVLSEKYPEAVGYAAAAHAEQPRKGTNIPYISHPLAVSALVVEHGGNEVQAIAALLHDVLEDCGMHHAPVIAERFGSEVLKIVEALTDGVPDENGNKPLWRPRKEIYLAHLKEAHSDAVLVSACDKLHNAMAIADDYSLIGDAVFDRFSQPKSSTIWYYKELAKVISGRLEPDHSLVGRLNAALARWAY
jgi:(p)ppGpp synthase/HD superfamily hydrolase